MYLLDSLMKVLQGYLPSGLLDEDLQGYEPSGLLDEDIKGYVPSGLLDEDLQSLLQQRVRFLQILKLF